MTSSRCYINDDVTTIAWPRDYEVSARECEWKEIILWRYRFEKQISQ